MVLFINGPPLAVIELKNAADENATIRTAFQQLQTYQAQVPILFGTNVALIASDGVQARTGTFGAGKEWFKPWRTISGRTDADATMPELQVVLEGVFDKGRMRLTGGKHWSETSISGIARRTLVQGLGRVLLAPPRHHPYLHEADA